MRITAEPRSDQINYEDFLAGPRVYTIGGVRVGTAEQKYDIQLQEEQRVWRPPLTVLRTLIACWGDDATVWQGRQVELYGDPSIRFGKEAVGGIRIKALSHLDEPKTVTVTVARGKRQKITIQPLQTAQRQSIDELIEQTDGELDKLRQLYTWAQNNGYSPDELQKIATLAESIQAAQPQQEELGDQQ